MDLPSNVTVRCRDCGKEFVTAADSPGRCVSCGGPRELRVVGDDGEEWRGCNHSTYHTANPDCPECRAMYGHIPESPAFQGSWLEKWLLKAAWWLRRRRVKR
jgi:ribosomal protein L37E